jgi:hypothetical protein
MALKNGPKNGLLMFGQPGEAHYDEIIRFNRAVDLLVMPAVLDTRITTQPSTPNDGDAYIIPTNATGAWSTHQGKVARWADAEALWDFFDPAEGWQFKSLAEGKYYEYGSGVWAALPPTGMISPMTAAGDLIIGGASGVPTRLLGGVNGYTLTMVAGLPAWAAQPTDLIHNPLTTLGDLLVGGASGAPARLAIGSEGQVLKVVSGALAFAADATGGGFTSPITTRGDLIVGDASGAGVRFGRGVSGQVLGTDGTDMTWLNPQQYVKISSDLQLAASDATTALVATTGAAYDRAPRAMKLVEVRASLSSVSSSGNTTIDIKANGTSILSSLLTILAGSKTSVSNPSPFVLATTYIADDAEITVDIVSPGTGAKGLVVSLVGFLSTILTPRSITTTNQLFILSDVDTGVDTNVVTAHNAIVPNDTTTNFPIGAVIRIGQLGVGATTVIGEGGVTIDHRSATATTNGAFSQIAARKLEANHWLLTGDLA